jgi:hypothetical protein
VQGRRSAIRSVAVPFEPGGGANSLGSPSRKSAMGRPRRPAGALYTIHARARSGKSGASIISIESPHALFAKASAVTTPRPRPRATSDSLSSMFAASTLTSSGRRAAPNRRRIDSRHPHPLSFMIHGTRARSVIDAGVEMPRLGLETSRKVCSPNCSARKSSGNVIGSSKTIAAASNSLHLTCSARTGDHPAATAAEIHSVADRTGRPTQHRPDSA